VNGFTGINGPSDNPYAMGISLSNVDFGIALISPKANQDDVEGMKWISVKASANEFDVLGIPGLQLAGDRISVEINRVFGADPEDEYQKVIDFSTDHLTVNTGPQSEILLDMPGAKGQFIQASGNLEVIVANYFSITGGFAFEKYRNTLSLALPTWLPKQYLMTFRRKFHPFRMHKPVSMKNKPSPSFLNLIPMVRLPWLWESKFQILFPLQDQIPTHK